MPQARATWTDERLDDLSRRVEDGFNRVDEDIRSLRGEMNGRFDAQDARLAHLESRFDALNRVIYQVGGAGIVTLVVGFAGVIAAGG